MKVKGTATQLSASTTKFTDATAVWVFNTGSTGVVTIRNSADDGDSGSIYVGGSTGMVIHLDAGEGLRGATSFYGTQIVNSGF
jgi:hypothetical protein